MSRVRPLLIALLAASLLSLGATSASDWADASSATIHPGVQTITDGGQCTANFIFTVGNDVLIGQAAHCSATGAATDTNGCTAGTLPLGTSVQIQGAQYAGTLVYSAWNTMRAIGETDANACAYNDFSLVRIDPRDHHRVNPSVPVFGGPDGIRTTGSSLGESVYTYGNSSLRLGLTELSPHVGTSLGTTAGGWTTQIYTVTPGLPGDSGSAVLGSDGQALGVLVTLALAPYAGSNGVTSINHALDYANQHGQIGTIHLEDGTDAFSGNPLSVLGGLTGGLFG